MKYCQLSAGPSSKNKWQRQASAPSKFTPDWIDGTLGHNGIEEVPFPLEEGENTALEPIPMETEQVERPQSNGSIFSSFRHFTTPVFIRTARDSRLGRNSATVQINGNSKKSKNSDERHESPVPSLDGESVSSVDNKDSIKKKGGLKRILRKVF